MLGRNIVKFTYMTFDLIQKVFNTVDMIMLFETLTKIK